MIFQIFIWRSPKGCCYGNQLNMGDVRRRRVESPLLLASSFDNGLANRKSAFKRFNVNNQTTSRPNMVNFRLVILEFTLLKRAILPRFARNLTTIFIRHVGVSKRIGRWQFLFQQSNRHSFLHPCRNLVRFGSVTPEFMT